MDFHVFGSEEEMATEDDDDDDDLDAELDDEENQTSNPFIDAEADEEEEEESVAEKTPFEKAISSKIDGDFCAEVTMKKSKVNDNKPIVVGQAILMHSKLLMLKFMYFLGKTFYPDREIKIISEEHLEPGSFITTYSDTDSIALALTKTDDTILPYPAPSNPTSLASKLDAMFLPIVKEDKIEVFFLSIFILSFLS